MKLLALLIALLIAIAPCNSMTIQGRVETRIGTPRHQYRLHARKHKRRPIVLRRQYARLETRSAFELDAIREHWKGWIGINYEYGTGVIRYIFPCSNLDRVKVQAGDRILSEDSHDFRHFYGPNPEWLAGQKVKLTIRKANGQIIKVIVTLARY